MLPLLKSGKRIINLDETWLNESRPAIAAHRLPTLREMKAVRAWKEVQGGT